MTDVVATRHPAEWLADRAGDVLPKVLPSARAAPSPARQIPRVRRIGVEQLLHALRLGFDDFVACRTDVIALCVAYPLVGVAIGYLTIGQGLLPLVFPMLAGFALVGPVVATGLYELSRRREQGLSTGWQDAFQAFGSPAIGSILALGVGLFLIFGLWIVVALGVHYETMGPGVPESASGFVYKVMATRGGHGLTLFGIGIGFLFAAFVLATNVVSFPLLLDRNVGVAAAVRTSVQVVRTNPGAMALRGAIVAGALLGGMAALLIGLAVVLPVLGHATWHLYRQVLPDED